MCCSHLTFVSIFHSPKLTFLKICITMRLHCRLIDTIRILRTSGISWHWNQLIVLKYMSVNQVLHFWWGKGKGGAWAVGTFQKSCLHVIQLKYNWNSLILANTWRIIAKRFALPKPVNNEWNGWTFSWEHRAQFLMFYFLCIPSY